MSIEIVPSASPAGSAEGPSAAPPDPRESDARPATIFDVARLAGVSHQTVSRVLNDLPNVRPATRERVQKAMQQLRYQPSLAARALVTKRSRTIGLVLAGGPDHGPSSTALAFNEAARQARYSVSMIAMQALDTTALRAAVESLLRQSVEAVVLIAEHLAALEALKLMDVPVPLVVLEPEDDEGLLGVSIDHAGGARAAVRHLAELGHTDIRHLAGPAESQAARARLAGWRRELSEQGLVALEPESGDWSPRSGYEWAQRLTSSKDRPSAVFVANDQMAVGVLRAFAEAGWSVPDDVSVVGFDDVPEAAFLAPPLTTVRQDFPQLGQAIMARLQAVLSDQDPGSAVIPAELVVRKSSSAPNPGSVRRH